MKQVIGKLYTATKVFIKKEEAINFARKVNGKIKAREDYKFFSREENYYGYPVFNSEEYNTWIDGKKIKEIKSDIERTWKLKKVKSFQDLWKKRYERLIPDQKIEGYKVIYVKDYIVEYKQYKPVYSFFINALYKTYVYDKEKGVYLEKDIEEERITNQLTPKEALKLLTLYEGAYNYTLLNIDKIEKEKENLDLRLNQQVEKKKEEYSRIKTNLKNKLAKKEEQLKEINNFLQNKKVAYLEGRFTFINGVGYIVDKQQSEPTKKGYYEVKVVKESKDKKGRPLYIIKYLSNLDKIINNFLKLKNEIKKLEEQIKTVDKEYINFIREIENNSDN